MKSFWQNYQLALYHFHERMRWKYQENANTTMETPNLPHGVS
jgi:hypothetical protein